MSIKCIALKVNNDLYVLADSLAECKQYESASNVYIQIIKKEDSIYKAENSKQVKDLREKYSSQSIELEIQNRKNEILRIVFVLVLILLFILLLLFYLFLNKKKKLSLSKKKLVQSKLLTERSIKNKSTLLSNMSHEIRTPLNALAGFSDLLTNDSLDDSTLIECRDIIKLNSDLLINLINEVVDLSCLDTNSLNIKLNFGRYEIVSFSKKVVATIEKVKKTSASVSFETNLDELYLKTDLLRLQQVLINLLVNATKFTNEGSIILGLRINDEGFAEFSVTDTGCGIPLDKQKSIFNRFEKINENAQGTGLGLYICKSIITNVGGNIWIDSSYVNGTRFMFTHPIRKEDS